ncbi:MAG TPA: RHS repeat-associated core domain-containing protein [Gemmatimonadales bacterium]|nr:RHS repeat-associated core domain-containing protein [Gemmatimonadales bacterium]
MDDAYNLTCPISGAVTSCALDRTDLELGSGQSAQVTMTVAVGTGTTGTAYLNVTSPFASTSSHYYLTLGPNVKLAAPIATTAGRAVVASRQPVIRALLTPGAAPIDTAKTQLVYVHGAVTDTITNLTGALVISGRGVARHNRGLLEWEVDSVHALAVGAGAGDSAKVQVTACDTGNTCATATQWIVLPNDGKPVLGFSGQPLGTWGGGFSSSFGPGLGVNGPEVEAGFGTVPYFSMGVARSLGFVYSTRQSYPRALVPVDLTLPGASYASGDSLKLVLLDGATRLDSVKVGATACVTPSTGAKSCRLVLQGDFSASVLSPAIQRKWLRLEATLTTGGIAKQSVDSAEVVLVDRRQNAYGSGWWPTVAPVLAQAGNDRILVGPTGTATIYRGNGDSVYLAPPGVFTALTKTANGWELRARASLAKSVFNAAGRFVKALDNYGLRDSVAYDDQGRVTAVVDPLGKQITIAYDGSHKLSTITDAGLQQPRQTRVQIDPITNQLVYDSVASPASRPATRRYVYQQYGGAGALLLTKSIGVIADTTEVVYDSTFRRRPWKAKLPTVQNPAGRDTIPVLTYTAYERQGYGRAVALDSTYAEMQDPRGNWTRSLLNRWRQVTKTWDALDTLPKVTAQAAYTADGLPLWSQSRNDTTTRIRNLYDQYLRPVRTTASRENGRVMRLDSLEYDALHRVIKRFTLQDDTVRYYYNPHWSVEAVTTLRYVNGVTLRDSTSTVYNDTTGQVLYTKLPGDTATTRYFYDPVWKNPAYTIDRSGDTLGVTTYDQYGRAVESRRRTRVAAEDESIDYRYRKSASQFNEANQVVRSVLYQLPDFASTPMDSIVGRVVYDRAGRDSLHIGNTGVAEQWQYDRLGREVRHWQYPGAAPDSIVYDLAGNPVKRVTRRGYVIAADFDSRNRDTLAVIPTIGTLRKKYAGPAGQLTSIWLENAVDSIGGVDGSLGWHYDAWGRLVGDTVYVGAGKRQSRYGYDTLDRPWFRSDSLVRPTGGVPLFSWIYGYEKYRGTLSAIRAATGNDSIIVAYDAQGRMKEQRIWMLGPYTTAGDRVTRTYNYTTAGALKNINTAAYRDPGMGGGSFLAGIQEQAIGQEDAQAMLSPRWREQHGLGGVTDTLRETLDYDAWERLTSWSLRKGNTTLTSETYSFDAAGNLTTLASGTGTYDALSDQLTAIGAQRFGYDAAGNLVADTLGSTIRTYTYDAMERLTAVRQNGVLIARYGYDVLGRRIVKRVYSSVTGGTEGYTRFVYAGDQILLDADSAGTVQRRYTWGPGQDNLLAINDGTAGGHYYTVQDRLGSIRGLVKQDGTWLGTITYRPYGPTARSTGLLPSWLRQRWAGQEYDAETGLYYMRARYYSLALRRFIQEDPVGHAGGRNVYTYVDGQVLETRDPSGLWATAPAPVIQPCQGGSCFEENPAGSFGSAAERDFWDPNSHYIPPAPAVPVLTPQDLQAIDNAVQNAQGSQSPRQDLGVVGNKIRGGCEGSNTCMDLFERYWTGGGDLKLSPAQFDAVVQAARDVGVVRSTEMTEFNGQRAVQMSISLYRSNEYRYAYGTATFYFDTGGHAIGFSDVYNFDSQPLGQRSFGAEIRTRGVRALSPASARAFNIHYP